MNPREVMRPSEVTSITFKRELLGCFALHRLAVWVIVVIFTFSSFIKSPLVSAFEDNNPTLLFIFVAILLSLLGIFYRVRKTRSVKWFALFLYSLARPQFGWGLTYAFGTLPRIYIAPSYDFLRIHIDGSIAFVVVGSASVALFATSQFHPGMSFMMSLIFQFALATWFALDLRRLDQRLGVDEATQGVIYVYIDAVLATGYVAMIVAAIGSMVLFIAAFAMSGPAVKGVQGGCAGCGGCTLELRRRALPVQRKSKCLFLNDEGSTFDEQRKRRFESQDQVMPRV